MLTLCFPKYSSPQSLHLAALLSVILFYHTLVVESHGERKRSIILWLNPSLLVDCVSGPGPSKVLAFSFCFTLGLDRKTVGGWSERNTFPQGGRGSGKFFSPGKTPTLNRTLWAYFTGITLPFPLPLPEPLEFHSQIFSMRTRWIPSGKTDKSMEDPKTEAPKSFSVSH